MGYIVLSSIQAKRESKLLSAEELGETESENGEEKKPEGGKKGLQTDEKNFLTVLPNVSFEKGKATDITLMPVKLGFCTGNEKLDGLPCFAKGAEGKKIFRKFAALSAVFGTELTFVNGLMKVKL